MQRIWTVFNIKCMKKSNNRITYEESGRASTHTRARSYKRRMFSNGKMYKKHKSRRQAQNVIKRDWLAIFQDVSKPATWKRKRREMETIFETVQISIEQTALFFFFLNAPLNAAAFIHATTPRFCPDNLYDWKTNAITTINNKVKDFYTENILTHSKIGCGVERMGIC